MRWLRHAAALTILTAACRQGHPPSLTWRRGGLGSKAPVTLTLRNGNDYAVKDIEILCAFTRTDGSPLTDRNRIVPDTVNINANQAKCSLVTASRIQRPRQSSKS